MERTVNDVNKMMILLVSQQFCFSPNVIALQTDNSFWAIQIISSYIITPKHLHRQFILLCIPIYRNWFVNYYYCPPQLHSFTPTQTYFVSLLLIVFIYIIIYLFIIIISSSMYYYCRIVDYNSVDSILISFDVMSSLSSSSLSLLVVLLFRSDGLRNECQQVMIEP